MASNAFITPAPGDKATAARCPILAMHARYEAAWQEYNVIDESHSSLASDEHTANIVHHRALRANNAETDALRMAILYKVPDTWTEAMILQFHVHLSYDADTTLDDKEREALATAIDTLFDFMASEIAADHETLGASFRRSTALVRTARRLRTGNVEA